MIVCAPRMLSKSCLLPDPVSTFVHLRGRVACLTLLLACEIMRARAARPKRLVIRAVLLSHELAVFHLKEVRLCDTFAAKTVHAVQSLLLTTNNLHT